MAFTLVKGKAFYDDGNSSIKKEVVRGNAKHVLTRRPQKHLLAKLNLPWLKN